MTKEPPKLSPHIENMLWLEAFRHHVARQPYSVSDFVRALIARWDYLRPSTQNSIKSELQQEFDRYESGDQRPGMTRNLQDWQQIRELVIGSGAIPIGTRFGLWEVVGEPSLLSGKGKAVSNSLYPCLCHGCNTVYQARQRNLLNKQSTGCKKCRYKEGSVVRAKNRQENSSNPICPQCGTAMLGYAKWVRERYGQLCKSYKCKQCSHSETICKPFDVSADHDKEI